MEKNSGKKKALKISYLLNDSHIFNAPFFVHFYLVLVSLFNGISIFVGYLMPRPFSEKNSSSTI